MVELITGVVAFIVGGGLSFFVLRNNPRLLNVHKIAGQDLITLKNRIEARLTTLETAVKSTARSVEMKMADVVKR